MSKCYQLPCKKCGHPVEVEGRHAGGTVNCPSCEAAVEVPTFRVLKSLTASEDPTVSAAGGEPNRIKGVLFAVGFGVAVIAGIAGGFLYQYASTMVANTNLDSERIVKEGAAEVEGAPIGALWEYWNTDIEGVELPDWQESSWRRYNRQGRTLTNIAYGILGVAALGLLVMLGSFFIAKTKRT